MDRKPSPTTPLNGFQTVIGRITIKEVNSEIFCIAIPKTMENKINVEFKKILKLATPKVGQSSLDKGSMIRLIRNSLDQFFIIFDNTSTKVDPVINSLEKSFYITEQSDAWVGIEISGMTAQSCLERICQLDLSAKSFSIGTAVRTLMEHLNVLIIKTSEEGFLLFSASSSAKSFLEAVETSARNVE